jgi:hypothetical protein
MRAFTGGSVHVLSVITATPRNEQAATAVQTQTRRSPDVMLEPLQPLELRSAIMPTTDQEKPAAKPRQRSRKADQRNQKGEPQVTVRPDRDESSPIMAAPAEAAPVAMAAAEEVKEGTRQVALSGEVLPPDAHAPLSNAVGLQSVAQAYEDYTRKSWQTSRFLVERLMTARSIDEAIEIHGEFAKQAYANFVAQSQKVCELYGELAKQFFRPFDTFAAGWTRAGR